MEGALPDIGDIQTNTIAGLTVRLARCGVTGGIPVLLTSPWPESIYAFRDVLPALRGIASVVAVDLPGFGQSEGRAELMSPAAMGRFIVVLAEQLGLARVHAVGPDVGALALLFAAAAKPDLFESLVVGSGATSVDLAAGVLRDLIASPVGAFAEQQGGDIGTGFVVQAAARPTPAAVLRDYWESSEGRRFEEAANFVRAYPRELPLLHERLPSIRTPVLVLAGAADPVVPPENGYMLGRLLPRCRQILLEGGHLIWEDAAAAYGAEIRKWVRGGYLSLREAPRPA